jgi:hypothetical protein
MKQLSYPNYQATFNIFTKTWQWQNGLFAATCGYSDLVNFTAWCFYFNLKSHFLPQINSLNIYICESHYKGTQIQEKCTTVTFCIFAYLVLRRVFCITLQHSNCPFYILPLPIGISCTQASTNNSVCYTSYLWHA